MRKRIALLIAAAFIANGLLIQTVSAQVPVFNTVTPNSSQVAKFDKFELNINLGGAYTNPYDYNDIAVKCSFVSPGGTTYTTDGFFMQDYTLNTTTGSITTSGSGSFRVRFSPTETGVWQYTLSCTNTAGTTTQPVQSFQCTTSTDAGFVRKNSSNYLGFDNGAQYIPVGENMCWYNSNAYLNYTNWLTKLSDNKGNFIRLWMPDWALGLEWKNGSNGFAGLKQYKQSSAYYLDWLMEYSRQKGVYIMLCLNHHGQVSTTTDAEWSNNPYNTANGGPCANTWDFFTNATAKNLIKNRLRYIIARYGYSRTIMSWELFNEVEWTDNFNAHKDEISAWHGEMSAYMKATDVNKHLVTTSYAHDTYDSNTWNLPAIDFTQTHYYVNSPNIETILSAGCSDYLTKYNKPTLNGEFGLGGNAVLSTTDPNGVYIHNSAWATAFSGGMGPAMTWWWDNYIEPQNLYRHFKPLSELLATIKLKDEGYKKAAVSSTGGGTSDLSASPGAGFGNATAGTFSIDGSGALTPGPTQLGQYLYGNSFNTAYRNPPVFTVTYPTAGQFRVVTGNSTGTTPRINISVDGAEVLNQAAAINSTYSVNIGAGTHTIKADNLGTDWILISAYVFTNIGSPLNAYMLRSGDTSKVAGWIVNKQYNWSYLQSHGGTPPPVISGATVLVGGVQNGSYNIQLFDCTTGLPATVFSANAVNNQLSIPMPAITWDVAMVATRTGVVTGIPDLLSAKQLKVYPNPVSNGKLYITYQLQKRSSVNITLYNVAGTKAAILFNGVQQAGQQSISSEPALASGMYLLDIRIGNDRHTEKIFFGGK